MKILRNLFLVLTTNFTYTTFCLSAKSFMFLNICRNYYYLYDMYVQRYKSTGENGKVYTSTLLFTKYRQARQQYKNLHMRSAISRATISRYALSITATKPKPAGMFCFPCSLMPLSNRWKTKFSLS